MPMNTVWLKIDGEHVADSLRDAGEKLAGAEGELVLDFSPVHRLDAATLRMLEALAEKAGKKDVKVVLHGVTTETYRVLKLTKLASRFAFLN